SFAFLPFVFACADVAAAASVRSTGAMVSAFVAFLDLSLLVGFFVAMMRLPEKLRSLSLPPCPMPGSDRTVTSAFRRTSSAVRSEFEGIFDARARREKHGLHDSALEMLAAVWRTAAGYGD